MVFGQALDSGNTTDELDGDSAVSGGVFAGYKHKIYHGIFASGEVFYHHTAQDERYDNGDILEVDAQYGAKIHLGYEWDWGSIYAIAGAAHLGYDLTQNNVYVEDSSFQPLFGLGTSYQFNEKFSAQLEFINTGDDVNIAGDQEKSLSMMTLLLGVSYHF
ncbi:outer membrane protein [Desulfogranum japonicum]|uniref:outer membrane protein n=1 Tax=Desulfogranum japonicum TaxID=231447 RepID=UPI000414CEE3|nr:outer membrane beta-barrel protein [Desulfogranum japonicum]